MMKELIPFLIVIALGTIGLTAQERMQDKLQLLDDSCSNTKSSLVILSDQDRDRLKLLDGTCLDSTSTLQQFLNLFKYWSLELI